MIEVAVRARSIGFAGLSALVDDRVFVERVPQRRLRDGEPEYPYIVIGRGETDRERDLDGYAGLTHANIGVDIYAKQTASALGAEHVRQVAEQFRQCWDGWSGTQSGIAVQWAELQSESYSTEEADEGAEEPVQHASISLRISYPESAPALT